MKKFINVIKSKCTVCFVIGCILTICLISFTGCDKKTIYVDENKNDNTQYSTDIETMFGDKFIIEEKYETVLDNSYVIMYDKDTGVKYIYVSGGYHAAMTVLYNADGSVQIHNQD